MKKDIESIGPICQVSRKKYELFCLKVTDTLSKKLDLHIFQDEEICKLMTELSDEIFAEEIRNIRLLLDNKNIGIAALDVPVAPIFDKAENTVYGAAVIMGVFNNIGSPNIEPINKMPFSLHTASHSNVKHLDAEGVTKEIPESVKMGFHNDGLLSSGKVEIPNHIVVYNLFFSYRQPGNFMWIPTALWDDAEKFGVIALRDNISVKIKLTPNYHRDKQGKIINTIFNHIEVPLSSINKDGQYRFFLNGEVLLEDNREEIMDIVQAIRDSLVDNPTRINIAQRGRRAFYLKNSMGFHARDIFEDPIEGVDLTRVFLRAVDLNAEMYPSS